MVILTFQRKQLFQIVRTGFNPGQFDQLNKNMSTALGINICKQINNMLFDLPPFLYLTKSQ